MHPEGSGALAHASEMPASGGRVESQPRAQSPLTTETTSTPNNQEQLKSQRLDRAVKNYSALRQIGREILFGEARDKESLETAIARISEEKNQEVPSQVQKPKENLDFVGKGREELAQVPAFKQQGVRPLTHEQKELLVEQKEVELGMLATGAAPELARKLAKEGLETTGLDRQIKDNAEAYATWNFSLDPEFPVDEEKGNAFRDLTFAEPIKVALNQGTAFLLTDPEARAVVNSGRFPTLNSIVDQLDEIDSGEWEPFIVQEMLKDIRSGYNQGTLTREPGVRNFERSLAGLFNQLRAAESGETGVAIPGAGPGGVTVDRYRDRGRRSFQRALDNASEAQRQLDVPGAAFTPEERQRLQEVVQGPYIWVLQRMLEVERVNDTIEGAKWTSTAAGELENAGTMIREFNPTLYFQIQYRSAAISVRKFIRDSNENTELVGHSAPWDVLGSEALEYLFRLKIRRIDRAGNDQGLVAGISEALRLIIEHSKDFKETPKDDKTRFLMRIIWMVNNPYESFRPARGEKWDRDEWYKLAIEQSQRNMHKDIWQFPNFWVAMDAAGLFGALGLGAEIGDSDCYPLFRLWSHGNSITGKLQEDLTMSGNANVLQFFRTKPNEFFDEIERLPVVGLLATKTLELLGFNNDGGGRFLAPNDRIRFRSFFNWLIYQARGKEKFETSTASKQGIRGSITVPEKWWGLGDRKGNYNYKMENVRNIRFEELPLMAIMLTGPNLKKWGAYVLSLDKPYRDMAVGSGFWNHPTIETLAQSVDKDKMFEKMDENDRADAIADLFEAAAEANRARGLPILRLLPMFRWSYTRRQGTASYSDIPIWSPRHLAIELRKITQSPFRIPANHPAVRRLVAKYGVRIG